MKKILLVEDSEAFQAIVASALEGLGVQLTSVANSSAAMVELDRQKFDLILLDIMLPGEDGFEFCRKLQVKTETKQVPVFFLTGKADIQDKVTAFSMGADDYITKPFDLNEFRARVTAKLAKGEQLSEAIDFLDRGDIRIDVAGQKVLVTDNEVHKTISLTPAEFRILYFLARNEKQAMSGRQLMEAVWGKDLHVVDQNLYTHMHSLRRKLGDRGAYIQSVKGVGYRFSTTKS